MQTQVQKLSQQQLQSVELLQLSTLELEAYVRELALDNPLVEPEEALSSPDSLPESDLLDKLRWLEENDRQNSFYQHVGEEDLDPLALIGTDGGLEETLFRFLSRQIYRLNLSESTAQTVRYLAACLDDNGYLRVPLEELSHNFGIPLPQLEECLYILRSLDPAGVGAKDLSQCLALQLSRLGIEGPPLDIVRSHLDLLAKRHYRAIAAQLEISVEEVQAAERIIRNLEPRSGSAFPLSEQIQYILPDVFIVEESGRFVARTRRGERPIFRINGYYRSLLSQSEDRDVKEYLSVKLRQAETLLWAVGQRESTLQRCSQVIADMQREFFRWGPRALLPLRMADVAQQLEVHESTISRTVREKYLQCAHGVYPMNYFFSRPATAEEREGGLGGAAARTLLRQLIDSENKARPLSDQKLCERMAKESCPISRRTVAKYREEMNLPNASARKQP